MAGVRRPASSPPPPPTTHPPSAPSAAEREIGGEPRRIYHLAIPPQAFAGIVGMLGQTGLSERARVIVEKPFGVDLANARELNGALHAVFREADVFRIDHFLGKESVENILALRFANGLFEPIWNRDHVDHVQIDVPEALTVAGRAGFYEPTGAFRDMIVTHLFQVLGFIAMEPPAMLSERSVRNETAKVFDSMKPIDPRRAVRGQYAGYRQEEGVDPASETETFVALEVEIDNWRWAGVPFYLRTGKSLAQSRQTITLAFGATAAHVPAGGDTPAASRPTSSSSSSATWPISAGSRQEPGPDVRLREVDEVQLRERVRADRAGGIRAPDPRRHARGPDALHAGRRHRAAVGGRCAAAGAPARAARLRARLVGPGGRGRPDCAPDMAPARAGERQLMSDRTWEAIVTAGAGLLILVAIRFALGFAFQRIVARAEEKKPADYVARLRTRLQVLRRVIVAFVFVIVVWSVFEIFPATEEFARTLLASGAVIALFVGVAFSVPLGNIGAGILLSLTQPVRIGDRITIGDVTGTAEEITLITRSSARTTPYRVRPQLADGDVDGDQPLARRSATDRLRAPSDRQRPR
jgi:hypothetical protein